MSISQGADAMTKPLFFERVPGLTVAEIAALTGAEPGRDAALTHRIANIAPLDLAGPDDLSYLDSAKFAAMLASTHAGACLMTERFEGQAPRGLIVLRTSEPYRAFVAVARKLFPDSLRPSSLFEAEGTAAGAFVHSSARLEAGVIVDPGAVIGPRAEIGAGTVIGATAAIGPDVAIGRNCAIGAGCSITHTLIGDRVIIHPGCRIGQDGFGFVMSGKGHEKIPQLGRVVIQDDVEIGAGTTIDRGGIRDTVIGEGTKIDNLVQIGHNVVIGRHCVIVAQSGLSGSVTLEDFVVLAARVGIVQHITVGEGAHVGSRSTVLQDVPPGARWWGYPAKPVRRWMREMLTLERMAARGGAEGANPGGE
jgi:UDP-3-O-[3-hydroxymyristoyl] glucosamine N-acyltransferase